MTWRRRDVPPPGTIAEIHATVDLERTLTDLGLAAPDASAFVTDDLLGARILVVERPAGPPLALAEPSTEGRLAATLARHGEGPAGWYVRTWAPLAELRHQARTGGLAVSRTGDGPFGRQVLALDGIPFGRHLILVEVPDVREVPELPEVPAVPSPP
ncbi:MAG: hypothetical protein H0V73_00780 [Chloroflexi bacterium]|nr:hypothetical protein [Chloroflexota bacterium]